MARGNLITQKKFSDVKLLLASGYSIKKAADIAEISPCSVGRIKKAENWEAYAGIQKKKEEVGKTAVISYAEVKAIRAYLKETNILLTDIYSLLKRYMEVEPVEQSDAG